MTGNFERFGKVLAEAIGMIRDQGTDPTEALRKTAESSGLTAPEISFVGAQINNSRALAHFFRTSGAERLAPFALADSEKVISMLGAPAHKAETEAANPFSIPAGRNLAKLERRVEQILKKAEACRDPVPKPAKHARPGAGIRAYAAVKSEEKALADRIGDLKRVYETDIARMAASCSEILGNIGTQYRRLNPNERARYSRRMVNGHSARGVAVLSSVMHSAGVEDPIPGRTSSECVFPAEGIYTDTSKLLDASRRLMVMQSSLEQVSKMAAGSFVDDFLANSAALGAATKWLPSSAMGSAVGSMEDIRSSDEYGSLNVLGDMSPETAAKLSGLRTRRVFMDAVLSDPGLRGYPLSRLAQVFNDAVQNDPTIVKSPPMLRAGMLQMLQSSVLDPFQLGQMVDIGKKRTVLFDAMRKEREAGSDAAETYLKPKGEQAMNSRKQLAETMTLQNKANQDIDRIQNDTIRTSWGELKNHLSGIRDTARQAELMKQVPGHIDALLATYTPDELAEAAKAQGLSGIPELKAAMLRDAKDGKGAFVPGGFASKAETVLERIATRKESERKDAEREKAVWDKEAYRSSRDADKERLDKTDEFVSAALDNAPAVYRQKAIREYERMTGRSFYSLAEDALSPLATSGSKAETEFIDARSKVTALANAMEQIEEMKAMAVRDPLLNGNIRGVISALTDQMVRAAARTMEGGRPADVLSPDELDAVREVSRSVERQRIEYESKRFADELRKANPRGSLRVGLALAGIDPAQAFASVILDDNPSSIQNRLAMDMGLPEWQDKRDSLNNLIAAGQSPDASAADIEVLNAVANLMSAAQKTKVAMLDNPLLLREF